MTGSDRPLPKPGRGWLFIDLAGLGTNTASAYIAALLWIVLCPLAAAVLLGAAAGISGVINCWDRGLPGLKEGARVMLVCPPDSAYGKVGRPGIPPNSTLVFVIDVLGVG